MPREDVPPWQDSPELYQFSRGWEYGQTNPDGTVSLCNRLLSTDEWVCMPPR